jgi:hypothetical protein
LNRPDFGEEPLEISNILYCSLLFQLNKNYLISAAKQMAALQNTYCSQHEWLGPVGLPKSIEEV